MTKLERLAITACLALAGAGCTSAHHEALGDQAYVERRYDEALSEYQLELRQGSTDGELYHKAAMAALNGRNLVEAANNFRAFAETDGNRLMVAADGLERVAKAASAEGNGPALKAALDALRQLVPGRALGAFGPELAASFGDNPSPSDVLAILPVAAAGAPDARLQDSLMFMYGQALARLNRCEEALPVFESLLRRGREPSVLGEARRRASTCALGLGQQAWNRGSPDSAEEWFCRAIQVGNDDYAARLAYLGLGDVWFARGDYMGSRGAFLKSMEGISPADSVYRTARRGLDRLRGFDLFQAPEPSHRRRC
jgi:tetratricopeptide (TPR) repeat protein